MKVILLLAPFIFGFSLHAQNGNDPNSTSDLSFLIGDWEVTRTNRPMSDSPRILKGTLSCKQVMDSTFIVCTYDFERPGKIRALDKVYFNYNAIYKTYESLWLSSTWPIKVLLQGQFDMSKENPILTTSAQFPIQDSITEFVQDVLTLETQHENTSFYRKTLIRTNKDPEGKWTHHMDEHAVKIK
ncbi:DUF1579 family protein [Flagellimonas sp. 2504JD4-2]